MHNQMLELDRTKISLENSTNQLNALQHKQFVENRVYDDDETLTNADNVPTVAPEPKEEVNCAKCLTFRAEFLMILFFVFSQNYL